MAAHDLITCPRVVERRGNVIRITFDKLRPNEPQPPFPGAGAVRHVDRRAA